MSDKIPHSDNPRIQQKIEKSLRRDNAVDHIFRRVLHLIERFIAIITILALLGSLGLEIVHMVTTGAGYFANVEKGIDGAWDYRHPMCPMPYLSGMFHGTIDNATDIIY